MKICIVKQCDEVGNFVWFCANKIYYDDCLVKTKKIILSFMVSGCMSSKGPEGMVIITSTLNTKILSNFGPFSNSINRKCLIRLSFFLMAMHLLTEQSQSFSSRKAHQLNEMAHKQSWSDGKFMLKFKKKKWLMTRLQPVNLICQVLFEKS